ncbi:hypothetical protein SNK05_010830 [Fusarium graminearum]
MPAPPIIDKGQSYPGPTLPSQAHIRLVHLQPGTDEVIRCDLITTTIEAASHYEALSYTWGDPLSKDFIWMKAQGSEHLQNFSVTTNCLSALKRLRYADKPRILWIDALAIDQSNTDERNHQVNLMSKIYSQAAGVIIYLGESANNSDLAIEYIMECDNPSSETTPLSYPKSPTLMKAVRDLFFRPWFTRVWVIQEVFLSALKTIYCGDKMVSWSAMENFKHHLVNKVRPFPLPYVVSTQMEGEHLSERKSRHLMWKTLLNSRHCEATDPRDKIYGLLPILDSFGARLGISPRYQDSPAKIYTDIAMALLADVGWCLLSAVQGGSSIDDLPSWVPDWSVPPLRKSFAQEEPSRVFHRHWICPEVPGPSQNPEVIMRKRDGRGDESIPVLHGYGYPVGKILRTGSTYIAGQTTPPFQEWLDLVETLNLQKSITNFESISSNISERWQGGDDNSLYNFIQRTKLFYSNYDVTGRHLDMSCPTLSKLYHYELRKLPEYNVDETRMDWETLVCELAAERGNGNGYRLPFRDIPFSHCGIWMAPSARWRIQITLEGFHARRCFITDTGYFGLAPEDAEVGDRLFFCVGASVPFVLREVGYKDVNDFHFVGESCLEEKARKDLDVESQPQPLYII